MMRIIERWYGRKIIGVVCVLEVNNSRQVRHAPFLCDLGLGAR